MTEHITVNEQSSVRIEAERVLYFDPFHIGGERVYVCGDTDDTPEARNVKCDIVCVPIGGTYTMNAKKAAAFVNELSPRAAIPIHYGTIVGKPSDAEEFERNVESSIRVIKKIRF